MSRTEGSGWGGGVLLYQICPYCGQKKAYFNNSTVSSLPRFKCTNTMCRKMFNSTILIHKTYKSEIKP